MAQDAANRGAFRTEIYAAASRILAAEVRGKGMASASSDQAIASAVNGAIKLMEKLNETMAD